MRAWKTKNEDKNLCRRCGLDLPLCKPTIIEATLEGMEIVRVTACSSYQGHRDGLEMIEVPGTFANGKRIK